MSVETTGVLGAGLMGRDIAGLLANAGFDVTLVDIDETALQKARRSHERELPERLREAGLDVSATPVEQISYVESIDSLAASDFVVEAVPEDLALKRDLLQSLERVIDPRTVVGTNTSSLTPSEIAAEMTYPERVVLFHFANPAIQRDLVEIAGDEATPDAIDRAVEVAEAIDKTPIRLRREYRANGLSRLSASIKCAATWELTVATAAEIDRGARTAGFDRGPLELIDLIGIDVHLATVDNLAEAYGDRYDPPQEQRQRMEAMIDEDRLGKKTGSGFFEWDGEECLQPETEKAHDVTPILAALCNEAHRLVDDGVADRETVNEILKRGGDSDVGPFDLEELFGEEFLRQSLRERHRQFGARVYDPVF